MMDERHEPIQESIEELVVEELVRDFEMDGRKITVKMKEEEVSACINDHCHVIGAGRSLFNALLDLLDSIFTRETPTQEPLLEETEEEIEL